MKIQYEKISKILFDVNMFDRKTLIAAQSIVRSIEATGVGIFPGSAEFWHFNDKIAQKYLFESFAIPCCPTLIFYDRDCAINWAASVSYPKIFKLKCGAGSSNVTMVKSFAQAESLINQMFGAGKRSISSIFQDMATKVYKHKKNHDWIKTLRNIHHTIRNLRNVNRSTPCEIGYAYFQDFMSGNYFDTRITVIGDRAFAFRRMVRKNDFRASGSGNVDWDIKKIDLKSVELAFETSKRIGARCMAYDIIYDQNGSPVIIECCYRFIPSAVFSCSGYWDRSLVFHQGHIWPQDLIIYDTILS